MPRKQKKYHFIYKTTNLINNKFYIGMHSTDDLEDGYFGSGKIIHYSVNKHGVENHKVEILEFLDSRESLKKREAEIVNEELLADPLNMNLMFGGEGGWDHVGSEAKSKGAASANRGPSHRKRSAEHLQKVAINRHSSGLTSYDNFKGKRHSEETKEKMRSSHKGLQDGSKNSQFGTCWISKDGEKSKKIKKEELQSWLDSGWNAGRKMLTYQW